MKKIASFLRPLEISGATNIKTKFLIAGALTLANSTAYAATEFYSRVYIASSAYAENTAEGISFREDSGESISVSNGTYATQEVIISAEESAHGPRYGYAEADLANGTLRAGASANKNYTGIYNNFSFITSFAVAGMGDSFSFSDANNGSAFSWSSQDEVSFSFDITGFFSGNNVDINQTVLSLVILQPGHLEDWQGENGTLVSFGPTRFTIEDSVIEQYAWTFGDGDELDDCLFIRCDNVSTTNLPGGSINTTISQAFTPGGDFDWIIELSVGGQLGLNQATTSIDADFSNTVGVSFTGLEGVTTQSASGAFPNTVSTVPIPGAAWFFGTGLIGLVGARLKC